MKKNDFKVSWTGKSICLCCNESVSVNKEYNLKPYHKTKHKGYNKYKPSKRKEKLEK